jgi:hypothetical protein
VRYRLPWDAGKHRIGKLAVGGSRAMMQSIIALSSTGLLLPVLSGLSKVEIQAVYGII